MERPDHSMNALFAQLGQAGDEASIARFIDTHRLDNEVPLHEAPFWNPAQAAFLREAIAADADWAEIIDTLNAELHDRP